MFNRIKSRVLRSLATAARNNPVVRDTALALQRSRDLKTMPIPTLRDIAVLERHVLESASRALASPLYLGDHTAIGRMLGRYKIYCDTRDLGFAPNVLLDGYWEIWLTQYMARQVTSGMVAVDVGANCGYYTLLLADLAGPQGRVFALEPNPPIAALLRQSISLNGFAGRTQLIEAAAANMSGEIDLFVTLGNPMNATFFGTEDRGAHARKVPLMTLDALLEKEARVDFIKIDAEGAEEDIFAGMQQTIARFGPTMVIEYNSLRYGDARGFARKLERVYGRLQFLNFDAEVLPVSVERVLAEHPGEDWLLVLAP